IEQRGPRIEVQGIVPPVDREPYVLARQRSSLRRRLAHRGWRRERQSCGPGRLEKAAPGRHGSKLEKIVHNTASTCVGEPPDEATLTKCNHTARTSLRVDCCDLLDTAPRERKAPLGRDPRPSLRIGADPAARHTVAPSTSRPPTLAISAIYTKSFINKRNWFRRAKRNSELAGAHWQAPDTNPPASGDHSPRSRLRCANGRPAQVDLSANRWRIQARPAAAQPRRSM